MSSLAVSVTLLAGYFAGSIPFGLLLARALKGVDLRTVGSGNIGATNASRALGTKWGLVVLVLDALKGGLPAILLPRLWTGDDVSLQQLTAVAGLGAVLGHMYSCWLGFSGGKGVATSIGVLLAVSPWGALTTFAMFVVVFAATRFVSLGSVLGAIAFSVHQMIALQPAPFGPETWPVGAFSLIVPALVIWKHRSNLHRLFKGQEPRFGRSRSKAPTSVEPGAAS
ncbi:glycerol-3-phosphate 1-O-acyltransferase PlsY [Planctellipticum variicoloris]|uniref:glycerol-3-phosphate 1-O-acyltransferase PlsY n=1 Tax=Planctellipticum variicoloris TaxID=3064265 RepID=UPI0030137B47|nr:glycerol-3-phosphate 1-O-acyltransferase PlsY [Planctomycetaceae bacterium SH412]